ncbi:hypothetical protein AMAG_18924 [Allomyces macrogynus ATCC 38327]|uniref:Uncharacterized protein n=1 Tax=Allomyces macrogynus (strain ATCC 38327) TaxID=578462 RepID=A0A0L0SK11_ALLM3|nr:hypothetical protein AMAG_18924 [Allomyces macrogynus ATCC 38327]|eukprot:KNE62821.1 hypothetical protein AMAG_18924 [Allomyces macrogynus ATCC 38327]
MFYEIWDPMAKVKGTDTLVSLDDLLNNTTVDLSRESLSLIRQLFAIPKVFSSWCTRRAA